MLAQALGGSGISSNNLLKEAFHELHLPPKRQARKGVANKCAQVLRQLDEDKTHREQEMEKLKAQVSSQQAQLLHPLF